MSRHVAATGTAQSAAKQRHAAVASARHSARPPARASRSLQHYYKPFSSSSTVWLQRKLAARQRAWSGVTARSSDSDLHAQIEAAAAEVEESLQGTSVFLVGMMGSGKSTVGRLLAQALHYCFFDTDTIIEQAAGKAVSRIFADEGEEAFRELETEVIRELSPFRNCVVSTGGGLPTRRVNWGHMQAGISIWLNGPPQLLAHRVIGDGTEQRPLLAQEQAQEGSDAYQATVERLSSLLDERREFYGQSDIMVSLEGSGPASDLGASAAQVTLRVLLAVADRIRRDAKTREDRKQFEIVEGELPASMTILPASDPQDPFLP